MAITVELIQNNESGLSVRTKLNTIIEGINAGTLGVVTPEDLEAIIDTVAPAKVKNLQLTSVVEPASVLTATWSFSPEADFSYYDVQFRKGTGNWISQQSSEPYAQIPTLPNELWSCQVFSVDRSGNRSAASDIASHTTAKDSIPPAMPINVVAYGGIGTIWVEWTPNTEPDFSFYEIVESENPATPTGSTAPTYTKTDSTFVHSSLAAELTLHYWVRAVDTSGNRSQYSAVATATVSELPEADVITVEGVTFKPGQGTGNDLLWTAGTISYGRTLATSSIPSGSVTWSSGTLYVYYVRGDSTFLTTGNLATVYAAKGVMIGVYRGGTDFQAVLGQTFTDGQLILGRTVGADQLVADEAVITGTAQIGDAIITDAKIVDLDVIKLTAADIVSNNALIGLINGANVTIGPGHIQISGTTTLFNWISGTDQTKIDGGELAARSVRAESGVFGQQNITTEGLQFESNSPSPNSVSWTSGDVRYIGADGNIINRTILAGSAGWTAGTLYLYYVQNGTSISATTDIAVAMDPNNLVLAAYRGGTDLITDYGRTVIDGGHIKGIMAAFDSADITSLRTEILVADSVVGEMVKAGSIAARHMVLQDATNLVPDNLFMDAASWTLGAGAVIVDDPGSEFSVPRFVEFTYSGGTGYAAHTTSGQFPVLAGKPYLAEWEQKGSGVDTNLLVRIHYFDGNGVTLDPTYATLADDGAAGGFKQVSATFTPPVGAKTARFQVYTQRDGQSGTVAFGTPSIRQKNAASLTVDGSIKAASLDVETLESITQKTGELVFDILRSSNGKLFLRGYDDFADVSVIV